VKLNRELVAAGSAAAVLGLARARLQELNAVNVTTALNQVAKRPDGRKKWDADPTLASELLAAARRFAQDGLGRELASTAWSCATLQLRDTLVGGHIQPVFGPALQTAGPFEPVVGVCNVAVA